MAELGFVSGSLGIVSLALQVSDSVMKLKSFLDSVKDAPDDINYTIRQIEALDLVLSSADIHEYDDDSSEATAVAMRTSKIFLVQAAGALETSVKDLDLAIGKRKKVGSFKAVLKQSVIEKLKQRLRDAQDLLVLSNQYYSQALQRRRHDMQREWAEIQVSKLNHLEVQVTQCTMAVRSFPPHSAILNSSNTEKRVSERDEVLPSNGNVAGAKDDCQELARSYKRVTPSITRQKRILALLKLPSWLRLTSLCLEIRGERSIYGMSLDVKAYRSVDLNSPVMQYAREGNVQAIQEMFSKGTATPHDTWEGYETVLSIAVQSGQIEVCRLLIEQGAHQHARLAYVKFINFGNPLQELKPRLEMIRILAGAVQDDDFFDFDLKISAIDGFHGETTLLTWILNNIIGYNYQKATIEDRAKVAIHLCAHTRQPRAASLVRLLLPEPQSMPQILQYKDFRGRTLLNGAAWALGEQSLRATQGALIRVSDQRIQSFTHDYKYDAKDESDSLQDLLSLVKEMVIADSDIHARGHRFWEYRPQHHSNGETCVACETPLLSIFSSFSGLRDACIRHLYYPTPYIEADEQFHFPVPAVADVLVPVMTWIELLYEAGIDLREYGRKEKELQRDGQVRTHFWLTKLGRGYVRYGELSFMYKRFSIIFKYGPKPSDWQFWMIEEMDDWFLEFWDMLDHPERAMPGAWDDRFDGSSS